MSALPTLPQLLDGYLATALTTMGLEGGWFKRGTPKAEMVRLLAAAFADPAHVRAAHAALDPAARLALEAVQRAGVPLLADALVDELAEQGAATPPPPSPHFASRAQPGVPTAASDAFRDVLARLELRGLVLGLAPTSEFANASDFGLSSDYVVPAEVRAHLPPPPPPPPAPPPAIERVEAGDAEGFGRQLFLAWSHLRRVQPQLLKSGQLSKRDVAALADQLDPRPDLGDGSEAGAPRIRFLRRLLEALGLLQSVRDGVLVGDEERARSVWAEPLVTRAGHWLAAWQAMNGWNELEQLPGVTWTPQYRTPAGVVPPKVLRARKLIVAHVAEIARHAEWVGFSRLSAAVRRMHQDLIVSVDPVTQRHHHRGANRYAAWANAEGWDFHGVRDVGQGWAMVEGGVIRQALRALHMLGLCDLGLDAGGEVAAFRLTAVGRALMGGDGAEAATAVEAAATAAEGARIVVQPNFRILAIGPVPEAALLRLERFADRIGTDRVLEYALTRQSAYRAQLAGMDGAAIEAELADLSGAPLPQNVARSLEDWQRLHEAIVVHRRIALLQADDAALMATIAGDVPPLLAPVAGSDTLARVLEPARLSERLQALGLAAGVPGDLAEAGAVTMDEDGTVRSRRKLPSLFLLGRLQRLARWDDERGAWRLDAAAADTARRDHGLDAVAQASAWRALIDAPEPAWLEQRLKAWSAHYAPATVHRVVLVELPSAEALADVLADPRAAAIAKRFAPSGELIAVEEADLAVLGEVLAAFGIGLKGAG